MTMNKQNNKNKWSLAGAADKAGALAKGTTAKSATAKSAVAEEAMAISEPVKSEPVISEPVKSEPVKHEPVAAPHVAAFEPPAASELVAVVEIEAGPVVVTEEILTEVLIAASTPQAAPEAAAWAKAWPGKSFELWNENAEAMIGFVSALTKAKSVTEVVELQAQFANERFDRFVKLSSEIAPLPKFFFYAA